MGSGELALLPWQEVLWQRLATALEQGRLPHALLLSGPEGMGKLRLARRLAAALLCEQTGKGVPCGDCDACRRVVRGEHPDLFQCRPEEGKRVIRVDAVRELIDFLAVSAHAGKGKVVILSPAEAMNVNAANSLLKTLEEPPSQSTLILLSHFPGRLPATIRSRCQHLPHSLPPREQVMDWLTGHGVDERAAQEAWELASGVPLRALDWAGEALAGLRSQTWRDIQMVAEGRGAVMEIAQVWAEEGSQQRLAWWAHWLLQLRRLQAGSAVSGAPVGMTSLAVLPPAQVHEFADRLSQAQRWLEGPVNIRLQLADLLLRWERLNRMTRRGAS